MSPSSEFSFQEEDPHFNAVPANVSEGDSDPADEQWEMAAAVRERWLRGEEKTFTLDQLKSELRAELGWKS